MDGRPMLQKLSSHITECLERACDCRRRAAVTDDPELKAELIEFERTWMHLMSSYEFVESLERFVLSAHDERDRKGPQ